MMGFTRGGMWTRGPGGQERNSGTGGQGPVSEGQLLGASKVKIWGLTGTERLRRQLARVGVADVVDAAAGTGATSGKVLILHSGWVFDESLVAAMATAPVGTALLDESSDRVVAAVVDAAQRATNANRLGEPVAELPSGLRVVPPVTLVGSYNSRLRRREIPFLCALDASTVTPHY